MRLTVQIMDLTSNGISDFGLSLFQDVSTMSNAVDTIIAEFTAMNAAEFQKGVRDRLTETDSSMIGKLLGRFDRFDHEEAEDRITEMNKLCRNFRNRVSEKKAPARELTVRTIIHAVAMTAARAHLTGDALNAANRRQALLDSNSSTMNLVEAQITSTNSALDVLIQNGDLILFTLFPNWRTLQGIKRQSAIKK